MLVKFTSSETGELFMFAEAAHEILTAIGKEGTARGTFTLEEMLPAAEALRAAVQRAEVPHGSDEEEEAGKERPIALRQRAWPFIEMLERTARRGKNANILWVAPQDF